MIAYRLPGKTGRCIAAVILAFSLAPPPYVFAASSEWVETEAGRIRISALRPGEDGQIRAVLDVDLLPGWKTYWRDPGEAGIPPTITVDRSKNIVAAEVHFPAPERITDPYSTWAGYDYPVLLPLTFDQKDPGRTSVLEADVFIGLCESVCIPFQTSFTLVIDPAKPANAFETRLVGRAFDALPEKPGHGFEIVDHKIDGDGASLTLSVKTPAPDENGELFVSGPPGWAFDTPRISGHDGNVVTYHVSAYRQPDGETLHAKPIRLLIKASGRAMETEITIP
ncbi:MAG: protein-disulfide reductase DsbD domain-containing protein [Pseudomonadota bacterium]